MSRSDKSLDVRYVLLLTALWLIAIAVVNPRGNFPLNDDWAYAGSARLWAATGRLRISQWAAPSLVSHLAWGALVIKCFGASYTTLRIGTLVFGWMGILAAYALGRVAFEPARAFVLALGLMVSPLFMNLSFSYMSDVPWLATMLWATVLVLRAERGQPARLLLAGALVGAAALARQFAIVMAPAFALTIAVDARNAGGRWWLRALGRMTLFATPLVVAFGAFEYWYLYVHGPTFAYRTYETPRWDGMIKNCVAMLFYLGLFALPLVAAQGSVRRYWRTLRVAPALASALVLGAFAVWEAVYGLPLNYSMGVPLRGSMPYLGNIMRLVGLGPQTLFDAFNGGEPWPHQLFFLAAPLTVVCGLAAVGEIGFIIRALQRLGRVSPRARVRRLVVGAAFFYAAWHLGADANLFDRYLLPLVPLVLWIALDATPPSRALSPMALGLLAAVGLFSVLGTREYLGWNRARSAAVADLERGGVDPKEIDAGYELNAARGFDRFFAEHHTLIGQGIDAWWTDRPRYLISFWPTSRGCRPVQKYPYFSWGTEQAVWALDCVNTPRVANRGDRSP